MSKPRQIAFWSLLVIFVFLSIWWIQYVPTRLSLLYRAIPANAAFVGVHDDIFGRRDQFLRSPLVETALRLQGVEYEEALNLFSGPEARKWLSTLVSRRIVVAYVPSLGDSSEPAWVAAGWIGGNSQFLRWQMSHGSVKGLRSVSLDPALRMWIVDKTLFRGGNRSLSVAIVEGMFLACISSDPQAVRYVVATYEGVPSMPSVVTAGLLPPLEPGESSARDFGWIGFSRSREERQRPVLTYDLVRNDENAVEARIHGGCVLSAANRPVAFPVGELRRILGGTPQVLCLASLECVDAALAGHRTPKWATIAYEILRSRSDTNSPAFVTVLGDEYSGRIAGMKIPGVVAGVRVQDIEPLEKFIMPFLDRMNAAYQWGIIPRSMDVGERRMIVFEGTRDNVYGRLDLDDRMAIGVCDKWLLVASNAKCLMELMSKAEESDAGREEAASDLWPAASKHAGAPAFAWVSAVEGAERLRDMCAVGSLALIGSERKGVDGTRRGLSQLMECMNAVRGIGTWNAWLEPAQSGCDLFLRIERSQRSNAKPTVSLTPGQASPRD